ncbi:DUF2971 domain-containing protein [Flammeovirga sp. SJP92]|uniref:DUF2971 domain-containing protein n=1 Tax=Flammeovirga sp. SJP92 TaxID=1775430 RepID=UPI000787ED0F|nr:DUF2971 domain-containing protein [Flammeovirga sp. SJP92]KXX69024.1 hypothetical protein AVL50_17865 [Flammeovirga sp. SJP92]
MMNTILYKYRSLDNFKFLVDIFLNKRLYAGDYKSMNDPMEGVYRFNKHKVSAEFRATILGDKRDLRFCSLSADADNKLLWAHYANGHNGISIGVLPQDIDDSDIRAMNYSPDPLKITEESEHVDARKVLSYKNEIWVYENEVRVFTMRDFVEVKIVEVIFGKRVSHSDKQMLKKLISTIDNQIAFRDEDESK